MFEFVSPTYLRRQDETRVLEFGMEDGGWRVEDGVPMAEIFQILFDPERATTRMYCKPEEP
jgi:hypothetical protein